MPYSEKESADFWASIDKAAEDAAPAPYSHSKVKELIRVCWALKKENADLRTATDGLRAALNRAKEKYDQKHKSNCECHECQRFRIAFNTLCNYPL